MKKRRALNKKTLRVILEIFQSPRTLTTTDIAKVTAIPVENVRQIVKRLDAMGWLGGELKAGWGANPSQGFSRSVAKAIKERDGEPLPATRRRRYRFTPLGFREAKSVLQRQCSLVAGRWSFNDEDQAPALSTERRAPHIETRSYFTEAHPS